MKYDCIICVVPFGQEKTPSAGPSVISSVLKRFNFKTKLIDYNINLYNSKEYKTIWNVSNWDEMLNISAYLDTINNEKFNKLLDEWVEYLINQNSKYIAISIFSSLSFPTAFLLIEKLKKYNQKIIIGGSSTEQFLEILQTKNLKTKKIINDIDHVIIGYGEDAIIKILNGTTERTIETYDIDFSKTPIPDYSDLDLEKYEDGSLPLCTSVGCNYNCSFCNRAEKYSYSKKPLELIEKELDQIKYVYKKNRVDLIDNIINFNNSHLLNLCNLFQKYDIEWWCEWRIRKNIPSEIYKKMKESGCYFVAVGIESGSEKVRKHMRKFFTKEMIIDNLKNFSLNNINIKIQLIVGYPNETNEDFQLTVDLIYELIENNIKIHSLGVHPFKITTSELKNLDNPYLDKRIERSEKLFSIMEEFELSKDSATTLAHKYLKKNSY
jgi:radical SAM superfamily enzyme YgiQ (UPF0313 family)